METDRNIYRKTKGQANGQKDAYSRGRRADSHKDIQSTERQKETEGKIKGCRTG